MTATFDFFISLIWCKSQLRLGGLIATRLFHPSLIYDLCDPNSNPVQKLNLFANKILTLNINQQNY